MPHVSSQEVRVSSNEASQIGLVVIGRNEGQRLRQCLAIAKSQCEHVIYVDSASTDGSIEAAQQLGVLTVSLGPDALLTAAAGRRAGFERLLQVMPGVRYVQFLDGDCILQPGWLSEAANFLTEHPEVAVVCGRRFEAFPHATFYNNLIDREWNTPVGRTEACGGDSLMRVEALRSAGSFRSDLLAGEEPELCSRLRSLGWEIWRLDMPMTEHDANIRRLGQWMRRAQRGGFGYAQVWASTRKTKYPLYGRQMASAIAWVVVIPSVIIISAVAARSWGTLLLLPVLYLLQVARISARSDKSEGTGVRARAAAVTMLSKIGEAFGVISFWLSKGKYRPATYRVPGGQRPLADERS